MSLVSTFYVGPAAEVAKAIRQTPSTASHQFASLDVSIRISGGDGLTLDDLDLACRVLGEMRSLASHSFQSYIGEVLDEANGEAQVVRLKKSFLSLFGALTDAEAHLVSDRLRRERFESAMQLHERMIRRAGRVIQTPLDYVAFAVVPAFAWLASMSVIVTSAVTAATLLVGIALLPWWRQRKHRPPEMSSHDYQADLLRLAELCRKAEREKADLVYDWSQ